MAKCPSCAFITNVPAYMLQHEGECKVATAFSELLDIRKAAAEMKDAEMAAKALRKKEIRKKEILQYLWNQEE